MNKTAGMRLVGLLTAAGLLGGCVGYQPGGGLASEDEYTYLSEPWAPTTVTLVDTRTGQTHWTVEVPVGQQCVIRFLRGEEPDNVPLPDTMRWQLMAAGKDSGELRNVVNVPPANARRVDVTLRRAPEMPVKPEPEPGPIVAEAGRPRVVPMPIDARPARPARPAAPAPAAEPPAPAEAPEPEVDLPATREPAPRLTPGDRPGQRRKIDVP